MYAPTAAAVVPGPAPRRRALCEVPMSDTDHLDEAATTVAIEASRRRFLRGAALLAVAALATGARAQHGTPMQHGRAHGHAGTTDDRGARLVLDPHPIPWADGTCAFCGMTIATPAGAPQGEGFRERTYAQWVLPTSDDGATEALHFESIACALNHAYVHSTRDGVHGTLWVTDAAGTLPAAHDALTAGRAAVYHWGERLQVAMMARVIAFAAAAERDAHAAAHPEEGRQARFDLATLEDLAPLPEMNLIPLLARHAGLLDS